MGEPVLVAPYSRTSAISHEPIGGASLRRAPSLLFRRMMPSQRDIAQDQIYTAEPFEDPTPIPVVPLTTETQEHRLKNCVSFLQVAGAFTFLFCSWGLIGCYGTFFVYFKDHLVPANSASELSWIGSVQTFLAMIVGILTCPLVDKGNMFSMCTAGSIIIVLGVMMDAQSTNYVQVFFSHGICIGLGSGLIYLPCVTCCSEYFSTRRGAALGVATLGSSIGGLIWPVVFNNLQPSIGYVWTMRTIGFMILGLLFFALSCFRPRKEAIEPRRMIAMNVFKDPPFLIFILAYLLCMFGLYVPNFFLPSFGKHSNFSSSIFPYTTCLSKSGGIAGRLLSILLTQRIGAFNLFIPRTIIAAALIFVWVSISQQGSFVTLVILYGFFTGSLLSSVPMLVSMLTEEASEINLRLCMASFISSFGVLLGPPIAGSLLQVEPPKYLHAQLFAGVMLTGSGLCLALARAMKVGLHPIKRF